MALLRLKDAQGRVTFDSTQAVGGVALGFFTVATGGSVFSFPDFVGRSGIAILAGTGDAAMQYSVDNNLGYLRFVFNANSAGLRVVLFAI